MLYHQVLSEKKQW